MQQFKTPEVTTSKIKNGTITQAKMNRPYLEAICGKNLINLDACTLGYYVNASGSLLPSSLYGVSDYTPINANAAYTLSSSTTWQESCAFFDTSKGFISFDSGGAKPHTFTTPVNAAYIRVNFRVLYKDTTQLEAGTGATAYEDYNLQLDETQIKTPIDKQYLDPLLMTGVASKNLFDKDNVTVGKYINATTGNLSDATGYNAGDYVAIEPSTVYVASFPGDYMQTIGFYTSTKVFISCTYGNLNITGGYTFTTPENTAYARVTAKDADLDSYQLELGNTITEYESFGSKVDKTLMKDLKPRNLVIVAKSGGDFTTINDALDYIKDSATNQVVMLIMPGTYIESIVLRNRYVSLVGIDKETCIIQNNSGNYNTPPLNISMHNNISNLTVIATHDDGTDWDLPAYAIHCDYIGEGRTEIFNCRLISYQHSAIGIGLWNNQTLTINSCELIKDDTGVLYPYGGAFLAHNCQLTGATNQKLIVKNCNIKSVNGIVMRLVDSNHESGGSADDARDTKFSFYNNTLWSYELEKTGILVISTPLDSDSFCGYIKLTGDSFGNNTLGLNAP
jgi:hypothetical protein